MIATRQLYATHYFDAALEMRWLIDDAPGANRGCYFVYATFVRSRALGGMLGALLRGRVRGQARTALEKYLAVTKDAVERTAADQPAPSTSSSAAPRSSAFRAPMP